MGAFTCNVSNRLCQDSLGPGRMAFSDASSPLSLGGILSCHQVRAARIELFRSCLAASEPVHLLRRKAPWL